MIEEEIKNIHQQYDLGNKSLKPSFRYIIMIEDVFGNHSDDFLVADSMSEAEEKALFLKNYEDNIVEDFVEIYEVIQNNAGEYIAKIRKSIHKEENDFKEYGDFYERHPMHVAWRTRGNYLGNLFEKNKGVF